MAELPAEVSIHVLGSVTSSATLQLKDQQAISGGALAISQVLADPTMFPTALGVRLNLTMHPQQTEDNLLVQTVMELAQSSSIAGVLGPSFTVSTTLVRDMLSAMQIPQLSVFATSPDLDSDPSYFHVSPGQLPAIRNMISLVRHYGWRSFAVFFQQDLFSVLSVKVINDLALEYNLTIVTSVSISTTYTLSDHKHHVRSAMLTDVRVFLCILGSSSTGFFRAAAEEGFMGEGYVWMVPGPLLVAPRDRAYVLGPDPQLPSSSGLSGFAEAYATLPPDPLIYPLVGEPSTAPITSYTLYGYDQAMVLLYALNRTLTRGIDPGSNREAVFEELRRTDFNGLTGRIRFTDVGEPILKMSLSYVSPDGTLVRFGEGDENAELHLDPTTPLVFAGNTTVTPSNFEPESCGVLARRLPSGFCEGCPPHQLNDPHDQVEECDFCQMGEHISAGICSPCPSGTKAVMMQDDDGGPSYPDCEPSIDPVSWRTVVLIVGVTVASLGVCFGVFWVRSRMKQQAAYVEALQQRADSESKFLSFLFHELRNALNITENYLSFGHSGVNRYCAMVEEDCQVPKDLMSELSCAQADLKTSMKATRHTLDILVSMLDIAKLADNRLELHHDPFDLVHMIVDVTDMASCLCADDVELSWSIAVDASGTQTPESRGSRSVSLPRKNAEALTVHRKYSNPSGGFSLLTEADELWICGDRQRLFQVLLNLLSNATKFCNHGRISVHVEVSRLSGRHKLRGDRASAAVVGAPHLRSMKLDSAAVAPLPMDPADRRSAPHISTDDLEMAAAVSDLELVGTADDVTLTTDTVQVRFFVRDTGPGIRKSEQAKLFKLFQSGPDPSGSQSRMRPRNVGIGLYLSLKLVKLMGGSIHIESPWKSLATEEAEAPHLEQVSLVNGTEFSFSMRTSIVMSDSRGRHDDDSSRELSGFSNPASNARRGGSLPRDLRVLVVDDRPTNRKLLVRMLTQCTPFCDLQWRVDEAESGERAIELVCTERITYDLVIMDEVLTDGGGTLLGHEAVAVLRDWEEQQLARPLQERLGDIGGSRGGDLEHRMIIFACTGNVAYSTTSAMDPVFVESGYDRFWPKPVPSAPDMAKDILRSLKS